MTSLSGIDLKPLTVPKFTKPMPLRPCEVILR